MNHLRYSALIVLIGTLSAQQQELTPSNLEPIQCFVGCPYQQDERLVQEVALLRQELAQLKASAPVTIELKDHDAKLSKIAKIMIIVASIRPAVLSASMIMQLATGDRPLREIYYWFRTR